MTILEPQKFLAALKAGLILSGQNEDHEPEWIGTDEKWDAYKALIAD